MTNIEEVIEIALNVNYAVKRYEVTEVILNKDFIIEVTYFDNLTDDVGTCKFSI